MLGPTMAAAKKTPANKPPAPKTVEDYLDALPEDDRAALSKLRAVIKAAAPQATERLSYGVPAFDQQGVLVSYAAFKNHCSFFPMSDQVMADHAADIEGHAVSKGTLHFTRDKALPAALVKKLVKARLAENAARKAARGKKPG